MVCIASLGCLGVMLGLERHMFLGYRSSADHAAVCRAMNSLERLGYIRTLDDLSENASSIDESIYPGLAFTLQNFRMLKTSIFGGLTDYCQRYGNEDAMKGDILPMTLQLISPADNHVNIDGLLSFQMQWNTSHIHSAYLTSIANEYELSYEVYIDGNTYKEVSLNDKIIVMPDNVTQHVQEHPQEHPQGHVQIDDSFVDVSTCGLANASYQLDVHVRAVHRKHRRRYTIGRMGSAFLYMGSTAIAEEANPPASSYIHAEDADTKRVESSAGYETTQPEVASQEFVQPGSAGMRSEKSGIEREKSGIEHEKSGIEHYLSASVLASQKKASPGRSEHTQAAPGRSIHHDDSLASDHMRDHMRNAAATGFYYVPKDAHRLAVNWRPPVSRGQKGKANRGVNDEKFLGKDSTKDTNILSSGNDGTRGPIYIRLLSPQDGSTYRLEATGRPRVHGVITQE
jgi:hypothetical protein